jgi:hypothetical protein
MFIGYEQINCTLTKMNINPAATVVATSNPHSSVSTPAIAGAIVSLFEFRKPSFVLL